MAAARIKCLLATVLMLWFSGKSAAHRKAFGEHCRESMMWVKRLRGRQRFHVPLNSRLVAGLGTEGTRCISVAAIGSLLMAFASDARPDSVRSVAISGAGGDRCAAWVSDRRGTSAAAQAASLGRIEWISGFLSGVNLFADPSGHLKGGVDDPDGVLGWIDNYCLAHPAAPLWAAAGALVLDLRNHPRK